VVLHVAHIAVNTECSETVRRNVLCVMLLPIVCLFSFSQYLSLGMLVAGALSAETEYIMKNGVFWDVTPCGSCKNRRFGGS
jgi:hypothetical protein